MVAPVRTHLWQVNIGSGTVTAHLANGNVARGDTVSIVYHPERPFWEIEHHGSLTEYFTFLNDSADYNDLNYWTIPVSLHGIGTPVAGPSVFDDASWEEGRGVACSPDGNLMAVGHYQAITLHAWDSVLKRYDPTEIDIYDFGGSAFVEDLAWGSVGLVVGTNRDTSGHLFIFQPTSGGFGAPLIAPAPLIGTYPVPEASVEALQVAIHPSGKWLVSLEVDPNGEGALILFAYNGAILTETAARPVWLYPPYPDDPNIIDNRFVRGAGFSPDGLRFTLNSVSGDFPFWAVWDFDPVAGTYGPMYDPPPNAEDRSAGYDRRPGLSNTHLYNYTRDTLGDHGYFDLLVVNELSPGAQGSFVQEHWDAWATNGAFDIGHVLISPSGRFLSYKDLSSLWILRIELDGTVSPLGPPVGSVNIAFNGMQGAWRCRE